MENKFINITLPDGTVLNKPIGTTGYDIAYGISESLANDSIDVEIDNEFKDFLRIRQENWSIYNYKDLFNYFIKGIQIQILTICFLIVELDLLD